MYHCKSGRIHSHLYENNNLINIVGMSFSVIQNKESSDKKMDAAERDIMLTP
jgi:hypothetical protein